MANEPKTKKYRLKPGAKHVHNGVKVEPGELVDLTETQFKAFHDKFSVPENQGPFEIPKPVGEPALPTPGLPQDLSAKTTDPNAPTTNPDNRLGGNAAPGGTAKL